MNLSSFFSFLSDHKYILPLGIIGMTLLMLALTLAPADSFPGSGIWSYDKLGHLILFSGWTYSLGLYHHFNQSSPTNLWLIFLGGVAFGALIELMQYLLPLNRHADPIDLLFDALGCLIAVWLLHKTISKAS